MTTGQIDLKPRHREQLESLLRQHLPDVEVWAYGSRVSGESHEGSDLDLVLRGPGLTLILFSALCDLQDALCESTIPFLVEVRDWARLPESFHREIERGYVVLIHK
jgi:predicted nucleotidyltransferase